MAKSEGITNAGARCPVCASAATTPFYSLADAPVTCATVFRDAASARAVQRGSIRLRCCNDCGFIYNDAFDPKLGEIGASYEASQASSVHFSAFSRSLASDWIERYALRGKRVLEVGCGHGEFLAELVRAGALEGIGLDPVADPKRRADDVHDRIELRAEFFGEAHIDVAADALICRHTLEHIDDVSGFLQLVRTWAERDKGRVVLFEVPGSERILAEAAFWDVLYEHCNYFVASSLRFAFALAGLHVMRTALVYERQYLLIEAHVAQSNEPSPTPSGADAIRSACLDFRTRSGQAIARSRAALSDLAERARPLVLWQGAAKTVGFLSALGDDGLVDCAIDLNVHRHGGYLPPFGLPVVAPEALTKLRPKNVVLMNPVYYGEVTAKLHALGLDTRLLTVDQLCSEQKAAHGGNIPGF